ncbi:MAG TPA: caspase family protein [Kofleriaceae bacterium]|jgi:hypothetical protein|nr:caspase family protein [Kofleriaceae bacterium]
MAEHAPGLPNYHVLLIGIDDYPGPRLRGCVNDIDDVQRVLLHRLGVPPARIHRLASPLPGTTHDAEIPALPATLDHMRAALTRLGSDEVASGDRVFIYYAGHGKRVRITLPDHRQFHREALVPVDFADGPGGDQFLFDFELNERLSAVVERTTAVTVVLDCCHAASVTRSAGQRTFFEGRPVALPDQRAVEGDGARRWVGNGVDACQVVSACLAHEYAYEDEVGGTHGGLLTGAFLAALDDTRDLHAITWAQIWEPIYARMSRMARAQHPELSGNRARLVFGGPPVDADPGIAVSYDAARGHYRIGAGTVADVTENARLAVYDRNLTRFPPLHTAADRAARIALLHVKQAQPTTAIATAILPSGAAVPGKPLSPGARARLVQLGARARLRYAVTPGHPEVQFDSGLLERADDGETAPVRLELCDGRWLLTDDVHTTEPGSAVLCALEPHQILRARAVLEHYHAYSLPLRIAASIMAKGTRTLQLTALRSVELRIRAEEAQRGNLSEVGPGHGRHELVTGELVCFRVRNAGAQLLRVTLLNVAASGRVQLLGDQMIDPASDHTFWYENSVGVPFAMMPPDGERRAIDRVVAIGRIDPSVDLAHLATETRFHDLVEHHRQPIDSARRDMGMPPTERWAAAIAVLDTRHRSEWPSGAPGA